MVGSYFGNYFVENYHVVGTHPVGVGSCFVALGSYPGVGNSPVVGVGTAVVVVAGTAVVVGTVVAEVGSTVVVVGGGCNYFACSFQVIEILICTRLEWLILLLALLLPLVFSHFSSLRRPIQTLLPYFLLLLLRLWPL